MNCLPADFNASAAKPTELEEFLGTVSTVADVEPKVRTPAQLLMDGMSKAERRAMARQIAFAEGDPQMILQSMFAVRKEAEAALKKDPALWEKALGWRVEAMLSGPRTHIVNTVSNMLASMQMPAEYFMAGVVTFNPKLARQGSDQMLGLFMELRESWTAARKAWKIGENILDQAPSEVAEVAGLTGKVADGGIVAGIHKYAKTSSRMLLTNDEFFKTLNYRSSVRAQSLRAARAEGITDKIKLAERIADDMAAAFTPQGSARNPVALEYARTATFTNPLDDGMGKSWGKSIQNITNDHPSARMVVPFVRTPTNIFRYAWKRTPGLNLASRRFRAELLAGGDRRAVALAQTMTGVAAYSTAYLLATNGTLTGGGPKSKELRAQWIAAGNQPYSIKLPGMDKPMSYRRLDPFAMPFGMIADLVAMDAEMDADTALEHAAAIAASIISNLTSKTYTQGITETLDVISSGDGMRVSKYLGNIAGSFVPNIARQLDTDDTMRETHTLMQELQQRIPGWSDELEARRNILGEPIMKPPGYFNRALNPFTVGIAQADGDVQDELVLLGRNLSMPAEKDGDIELTDREEYDNGTGQSPYDRMLQLMSSPIRSDKTLREAMTELVKSERWAKASDGPDGKKFLLASGVISKYQETARKQVEKEYTKLADAVKLQKNQKRAMIRGGQTEVDRITSLFQGAK